MAVAVALACAGMFEFNFGDTEVFYLMLDVFALVIANIEVEDPLAAGYAVPQLRGSAVSGPANGPTQATT